MDFFYAYPEPLDESMARHIQAWKTAEALSALFPVTLAAADRCAFSARSAWLRVMLWPRHLRLGPLKISFQSRFISRCLEHIDSLPEDAVIYLRHLRLADEVLERRPRRRVVFEVHEFFSANPDLAPERAAALEKMEARVFLRSAGLVCITRGLVEALHGRFLKLPPVQVVSDACDLPVGVTPPAEACDLVYAGSLQPWKGVETLVQAMAYLPGRTLRVVGGEPAEVRGLEETARLWRVSDRCRFLGRLPHAEVFGHLAGARLAVVPNRAHAIGTAFTSPLKVFEYLAAGKPVLASDLPSLREALTGATARFFAPDSPRSLATAADALLKDPRSLESMSVAARALAAEHTWEKRAERIAGFLGRAVRPPERPQGSA